jgi:hypothetical protein
MAMGHRARDWLGSLHGYAAIAVGANGGVWHTARFASQASPHRPGCSQP